MFEEVTIYVEQALALTVYLALGLVVGIAFTEWVIKRSCGERN